jgi:hypothetical protein
MAEATAGSDWIKVYDLRKDPRVGDMQRVSLGSADDGLSLEPALVGSDAWWSLVASEALPRRQLIGTIETPRWTGHNDWPEIRVRDERGRMSDWNRLGDITLYSKGRGIRIVWVEHPWKSHSADRMREPNDKVVLEMLLEPGNWRPTVANGRRLLPGWDGGPAS